MLNLDAYNRLIAHINEDDEITAIAVQALLNQWLELADERGFSIEDNDVIDHEDWSQARKDVENLRYAEIELSSYWKKDASDEDYTQVVKTIQAYMPRGWFATLVTKANIAIDTGRCGPDWHEPACTDRDHTATRKVVAVTGRDNAGWTLEDYVIPRLASGNWFAKEVTA